MVTFRKITQREWEKYPEPTPPKPTNRWDEVLGVLDGGDLVELEVTEDKLKGVRIGLARSASTRGFRLDFRYMDNKLAIRKSTKPVAPKEPRTRPIGRPRKPVSEPAQPEEG